MQLRSTMLVVIELQRPELAKTKLFTRTYRPIATITTPTPKTIFTTENKSYRLAKSSIREGQHQRCITLSQ